MVKSRQQIAAQVVDVSRAGLEPVTRVCLLQRSRARAPNLRLRARQVVRSFVAHTLLDELFLRTGELGAALKSALSVALASYGYVILACPITAIEPPPELKAAMNEISKARRMRIAAADQKFGFVFGQRGLTMEGCSSFFLPRLVGMTKANDFVLTARIFECGTEADCGLFTEVVPSAEEVLPKAMEIAKHMALNVSPMCAPLSSCCGSSGCGCGSAPAPAPADPAAPAPADPASLCPQEHDAEQAHDPARHGGGHVT